MIQDNHSRTATILRTLDRIRQEVARQPLDDFAAVHRRPLPQPSRPSTAQWQQKKRFRLAEFTDHHDEAFIRNAYRGILGREPDAQGLQNYLERLRSGQANKVEILGTLRLSPEGRRRGVRVPLLFLRFLLQRLGRIPIMGYFIRGLLGFLRLPRLTKDIQALETYIHQNLAQLKHHGDLLKHHGDLLKHHGDLLKHHGDLQEEIEHRLTEAQSERKSCRPEHIQEKFAQLKNHTGRQIKIFAQEVNDHLKALTEQNNQVVAGVAAKLEGKFGELEGRFQDYRLNLLDQQRRLQMLLEETRRRLPEPLTEQQLQTLSDEEDHLLDALYVSLEDRFRGTRSEIKERLQIYLPYLPPAAQPHALLDLGCGRGEWLELLKEQGYRARGIDLNRVLVMECQQRALQVSEQEAIACLRRLPDNSLNIISAFHLIEHLPLKVLVALLDESLRVLKPGGQIIFETPNPENLVVGAYTFYFDPTHRNPLPPAVTQFLAEQRGFVDTEILRLHPREEIGVADPFKEQWFCRETDYALLARKA